MTRHSDRRRRARHPRADRRHPRRTRATRRAWPGTATQRMAEINARRAGPDHPRHLAQGQPAGRDRHPQAGEARQPGDPGRDHLGPRQHRDRGRRDQAGRLRLHREAVQHRPADGGDRAARMETSRLRRENAALKRGATAPSRRCWATRRRSGQLQAPARQGGTKSNGRVMLTGPAGAGKEVAARYIHAQLRPRQRARSSRSPRPRSAPSGWRRCCSAARAPSAGVEPGLLEQAHGGIIFFDEVADMPLGHPVQDPAGARRPGVPAGRRRRHGAGRRAGDLGDDRDLAREIAAGPVPHGAVPPAERGADPVPGARGAARRHPDAGAAFPRGAEPRRRACRCATLAPEAEAQLQTMRWPGNVRQLRNTLERVLILGRGHGADRARGAGRRGRRRRRRRPARCCRRGLRRRCALREARELFEREYLLTQINRFGGNISRTASFVGHGAFGACIAS